MTINKFTGCIENYKAQVFPVFSLLYALFESIVVVFICTNVLILLSLIVIILFYCPKDTISFMYKFS